MATVRVEDIQNAMSIDHVKLDKTSTDARRVSKVKYHGDVSSQADATRDEYFVERIVHHNDDDVKTKYLAPWYGYRPNDDT